MNAVRPQDDPMTAVMIPAYDHLAKFLLPGKSLLDAGCYSGHLWHYLRGKGLDISYTGVDMWQEAIDVGLEYANINLKRADILTDDLGTHDVVWCSNIPWQKYGNERVAVKRLVEAARSLCIFAQPKGTREDEILEEMRNHALTRRSVLGRVVVMEAWKA